jgi:sugar/nucleoside kinase (ribokinase family)
MTSPNSSILVVGTVALDDIRTPSGRADGVIGGAAVHFSAAASLFASVRLVGVIGNEYPIEELTFLRDRGVDLAGLQQREGSSFRWGGTYHADMNTRDTNHTEVGVFAEFHPILSEEARSARWVFLANADPTLQLFVLDQIDGAELVACDTMNYWISGSLDPLMDVISRIDMITLNDEEARQISGISNLAGAAQWIQERGPRYVLIKKGEHGAAFFSGDDIFLAPGYPLREVKDPTGAGDAFAGGMFGQIARFGSVEREGLCAAVVYGCALGSFACEAFGPGRMVNLTLEEVEERVKEFVGLTRFKVTSHMDER